jgi:hypothetical protein
MSIVGIRREAEGGITDGLSGPLLQRLLNLPERNPKHAGVIQDWNGLTQTIALDERFY